MTATGNEKRKHLRSPGLYLEPELHKRLGFYAAYAGMTKAAVLRQALVDFLDKHEPSDKVYSVSEPSSLDEAERE